MHVDIDNLTDKEFDLNLTGGHNLKYEINF